MMLGKLQRAHPTLRGHFAPAYLVGSNMLRAYLWVELFVKGPVFIMSNFCCVQSLLCLVLVYKEQVIGSEQCHWYIF